MLLLFGAKSRHCFHIEVVYFVSSGQQTVMFVNTPRVYKRPNFSLKLEKNFDARLVGRVIRTQNRSASEVSKCFIYRFLLDHRKLLLNVNCGVKIVYDMYVASHH